MLYARNYRNNVDISEQAFLATAPIITASTLLMLENLGFSTAARKYLQKSAMHGNPAVIYFYFFAYHGGADPSRALTPTAMGKNRFPSARQKKTSEAKGELTVRLEKKGAATNVTTTLKISNLKFDPPSSGLLTFFTTAPRVSTNDSNRFKIDMQQKITQGMQGVLQNIY
jgi:hypothetical protein